MSLNTHILLYAGYALAALTVGFGLDQVGGDADPFIGGLAFFAVCAMTHAGLAAWHAAGLISNSEERIGAEMNRLRSNHRELMADIDALAARMEELDQRMSATGRAPQIAPSPAKERLMIDQVADKAPMDDEPRAGDERNASGATEIVRSALAANRVELHLQPIVELPQRRTVFYEAFTRLKDETGRLVLPQEFIPAAEQAGLMAQIDNLQVFRCARLLRRMTSSERKVAIFCNISLPAFADERSFAQLLDFLGENRDLACAIVFEIPQSAFERRTSAEARAMAMLAELGFRFSIDKVSRIDVDLPDLERAKVRYLKIPERVMAEQMLDGGMRPRANLAREVDAAEVAAICARHGVELIIERVETQDAGLRLLDLDIAYAQGHLFGAPRAVKESALEETASVRKVPARGRKAVA
jgi:cyclic-di-GMP phosphodiesterase TipF (flagellum assembly factor)